MMQNSVPKYVLKTEEKVEPTSQVEELKLKGKVKVRIGSQLSIEQKEKQGFALENINNFVEHSEQMSSIDLNIIEHCLEESPKAKPTCQKLQYLKAEQKEAAYQEVERLLNAGFIREVKYPPWLANVIMV